MYLEPPILLELPLIDLAALKFCFKTCVAMKFVDDDDDDDQFWNPQIINSAITVCPSLSDQPRLLLVLSAS